MGTAVSTSVADSVQTAVNQTYQSAKNTCDANCNQLISGNVIVLNNSTAGNIQFTQRCTADASCYMKNAVDASVTAFQDAKVGANASPALFPGVQVNTTVSSNRQDITNELTQILENLCNANVNQTIQDNIIYATDSTLKDIGFLQEGNASARCVMENSARLQLQMKQTGDTTATSGRNLSFISAIIALVIIVVIIVVVMGAIKKNTAEKPKEGQGDQQGQPGQPGQKGQGSLAQKLQGQFGGAKGGSRTGASRSGSSSFKGFRK